MVLECMDGLYAEISGDYVISDVSPCFHNHSKGEVSLHLESVPLRGTDKPTTSRGRVGQAKGIYILYIVNFAFIGNLDTRIG